DLPNEKWDQLETAVRAEKIAIALERPLADEYREVLAQIRSRPEVQLASARLTASLDVTTLLFFQLVAE
ncbi:MAG: hypothetical protein AAF368_15000, partial [Planctomycetota bacterium]